MGCDLCVTDLQDVRSAEQEDKERRERRVWTARRVVVGRASHELFFKIASTSSPTTRKQKKA